MKLSEIKVMEGVGDELMAYMDFADVAYPKPDLRQKYDTLATNLFARHFSFRLSPTGRAGNFVKDGVNVMFPGLPPPGAKFRGARRVMVSIHSHDPGTGQPRSNHETYEIDDMIDDGADLDFIFSGGDS